MKVSIDNKQYEAPPGATILDVALANGLETIPTLCSLSALSGGGSCRLCIVEVDSEPPTLATACTLCAREGLSVRTDTPMVLLSRRLTLSYLVKRDPSPAVKSLVRCFAPELQNSIGMSATGERGCSLCGICVRTCEALGIGAIEFVGRGQDRRVERRSDAPTNECIGCRACERLCPSDYLHAVVQNGMLEPARFPHPLSMASCRSCGSSFATHAAIDYVAKHSSVSRRRIELCPQCKRQRD